MPVSTCHWRAQAYPSVMQQASEPEVLIARFRGLGLAITRIRLEAGPPSIHLIRISSLCL
jgi:hypothetical protein